MYIMKYNVDIYVVFFMFEDMDDFYDDLDEVFECLNFIFYVMYDRVDEDIEIECFEKLLYYVWEFW